jgi:hypothetical protein
LLGHGEQRERGPAKQNENDRSDHHFDERESEFLPFVTNAFHL